MKTGKEFEETGKVLMKTGKVLVKTGKEFEKTGRVLVERGKEFEKTGKVFALTGKLFPAHNLRPLTLCNHLLIPDSLLPTMCYIRASF